MTQTMTPEQYVKLALAQPAPKQQNGQIEWPGMPEYTEWLTLVVAELPEAFEQYSHTKHYERQVNLLEQNGDPWNVYCMALGILIDAGWQDYTRAFLQHCSSQRQAALEPTTS